MTSEKDLTEKLVRIIDWSRGPRTGTHTVAWQLYSDAARAAIAAMLREIIDPSETMLLARLKFKGEGPEDVKRAWRAMLRAFAHEQGIEFEA